MAALAQIRAADADYDKHVSHLADFLRRLLDACKFLSVIVFRKIEPAEKIVSCSLSLLERILRDLDERLRVQNFVILHIPPKAVHLQFHRHAAFPLNLSSQNPGHSVSLTVTLYQ